MRTDAEIREGSSPHPPFTSFTQGMDFLENTCRDCVYSAANCPIFHVATTQNRTPEEWFPDQHGQLTCWEFWGRRDT